MKKCKIRVGFFLLLMLISLIISSYEHFPSLIAAVAIHELGHILMAKLIGIKFSELKLGLFGASLTPTDTLYSYKDEIILCLGGPLFNFLSIPISALLFDEIALSFSQYSLTLGTLNLLPIVSFDGGRIFAALLSIFFTLDTTQEITKAVSFIFIFSLWCISVYLLMKVTASLSLFIFSASLFVKIFVPHSE